MLVCMIDLEKLTGCSNKTIVMFHSQERVRKVTEELLQQAGNTVNVVEEVLGVPEI